jgi:hypothetical protein
MFLNSLKYFFSVLRVLQLQHIAIAGYTSSSSGSGFAPSISLSSGGAATQASNAPPAAGAASAVAPYAASNGIFTSSSGASAISGCIASPEAASSSISSANESSAHRPADLVRSSSALLALRVAPPKNGAATGTGSANSFAGTASAITGSAGAAGASATSVAATGAASVGAAGTSANSVSGAAPLVAGVGAGWHIGAVSGAKVHGVMDLNDAGDLLYIAVPGETDPHALHSLRKPYKLNPPVPEDMWNTHCASCMSSFYKYRHNKLTSSLRVSCFKCASKDCQRFLCQDCLPSTYRNDIRKEGVIQPFKCPSCLVCGHCRRLLSLAPSPAVAPASGGTAPALKKRKSLSTFACSRQPSCKQRFHQECEAHHQCKIEAAPVAVADVIANDDMFDFPMPGK